MRTLKTGDVLHCTRNSSISSLIRFFTNSKISHTAVVVEIYNKTYIVEAQKNGVNLKSLDNWILEFGYTYEISRPLEVDEKEFTERALSVTGVTGYDFESLLFRKPKEILTKRWRHRQNEHKKMFCSEYVAWIFELRQAEKLTPKDLYLFMTKSPNFLTVK